MNVAFTCPKCQRSAKVEFDSGAKEIACPQCGYALDIPAGAVVDGHVHRCLVCPSSELFVRKDFSQRLVLLILFVGLGASCITWYFHMRYATLAILGGTALLDAVLYMFVGNLLECYRCQAGYRGVTGLDRYAPFDLEVHERHRQQLARLRDAGQVSTSTSPGDDAEDPLPQHAAPALDKPAAGNRVG